MPFQPDPNSLAQVNISIITMGPVGSGKRGTVIDILPELDMLKAAILYGDHIEILSGAYRIWEELQKFQDPDSMDLERKLQHSISLCKAAKDIDLSDDARNGLELLHDILQQFKSVPESASIPAEEMKDFINWIWPQVHPTMQRLILPELPTLLRLIDQKWVEVRDAFTAFPPPPDLTVNYNPDIDMSLFTPEIKRKIHSTLGRLSALGLAADAAISNPRIFPMLDANVSGLVKFKGDTSQANDSIRRAAAELAKGIFARLPTFEKARLDEIVQIRSELNPYVQQFQVALGSMAAKIRDVTTNEFPRAVEEMWFTEVLPEIHTLDEAVRRNRYLGVELLQGAVTKPEGIVAMATGGLVIGVTQSGLTSLISPAIMAAVPAISRAIERRKVSNQLEQHRFFFLYKLSKTSKGNARKKRKRR